SIVRFGGQLCPCGITCSCALEQCNRVVDETLRRELIDQPHPLVIADRLVRPYGVDTVLPVIHAVLQRRERADAEASALSSESQCDHSALSAAFFAGAFFAAGFFAAGLASASSALSAAFFAGAFFAAGFFAGAFFAGFSSAFSSADSSSTDTRLDRS